MACASFWRLSPAWIASVDGPCGREDGLDMEITGSTNRCKKGAAVALEIQLKRGRGKKDAARLGAIAKSKRDGPGRTPETSPPKLEDVTHPKAWLFSSFQGCKRPQIPTGCNFRRSMLVSQPNISAPLSKTELGS